MISNLISVEFGALVLFGAFLYKLRHLYRTRSGDPGRLVLIAVVVHLGVTAIILVLQAQLITASIDAAVGLSGFVQFVSILLAMLSFMCIRMIMPSLRYPREKAIRLLYRQIVLMLILVAVMAVLFAIDHPPVSFRHPYAGVYCYVFFGYFVWSLVAFIGPALPYARAVPQPLFRMGLRCMVGTYVMAIGFAVIEVTYLLDLQFHLHLPNVSVAGPFFAMAAPLDVVGMSIASWGPRVNLDLFWERLGQRRAISALRPLWKAVTEAVPTVVMDRRLMEGQPAARQRPIIAARQVIEIQVAWLSLAPHIRSGDLAVIDALACDRRLKGNHREAVVTAAQIAVALHRHKSALGPPSESVDLRLGQGAATSPAQAARFLTRVARHFSSRFVRQAIAKCTQASFAVASP